VTRSRDLAAHGADRGGPCGYFAYGSNMATQRLQARVPSARLVAVAQLPGFRFVLNKRSRDGSAKANLARDPAGAVWGVLWSLDAVEWPRLDACEGGYERVPVDVVTSSGEPGAMTYLSTRLAADPVAYTWYRALLVAGAREHGLPAEWIAALEALPARPDSRGPDEARAVRERAPR
jgi:hypothetical protein